jgi:hypothetical protein
MLILIYLIGYFIFFNWCVSKFYAPKIAKGIAPKAHFNLIAGMAVVSLLSWVGFLIVLFDKLKS